MMTIQVSELAGSNFVSAPYLCVGSITENKLFQLAGSPDNHASVYETLVRFYRDSKIFSESNGSLRVNLIGSKRDGISCFQLLRSGSQEGNNGVVSVLVFNENKEIIRW